MGIITNNIFPEGGLNESFINNNSQAYMNAIKEVKKASKKLCLTNKETRGVMLAVGEIYKRSRNSEEHKNLH